MNNTASTWRRLLNATGSVRLGIVLMVLLAIVSVSGTLVLQQSPTGLSSSALRAHYGEWAYGVLNAIGLTDVFHSPWYLALLGALALNMLCLTVARFSLKPRKLGFLFAHAGVLLILAGGATYFAFGDKGLLLLREGEAYDKYISRRTARLCPLGFTIRLDRFEIDSYPSGEVREYRSKLTIIDETGEQARVVRVNHPVSHRGFQIFQEDFDSDLWGKSSQLAISRDPALPLVYVGLLVMTLGVFLACFVRPTRVAEGGEA